MREVDVAVVGGGPAGLAGAVVLARARRSVVVFDDNLARNRFSPSVHNLLGREGISPAELRAAGLEELRSYGGVVEHGTVQSLSRSGDGFALKVADEDVLARKVLYAAGAHDELPDVPGIEARWGRDVLHCSYCHGWEVSGKRIAVLGAPGGASYQAGVFRRFSDRVTIITHDWEGPGDDERAGLANAGVAVVEARIVRLVIESDVLVGVELDDQTVLELDALVVSPRIMARAELLRELGVAVDEARIGDVLIGTYVPTVAGARSAVDGLYLAGNVAYVGAQVARSSADGMSAGVMIDEALAHEDETRGSTV